MDLTYKNNFSDDPALRTELIRFINVIHRLDLTRWSQQGFWDKLHRPFSCFDGKQMVSNVSLYSMDLTVMGRRCRVAQVSGVGTLPEYRRRGLSSELTRQAMDWARPTHDFFFLFADEEAFSLYRKNGFRRVAEHQARIQVVGDVPRPGAEKLDLANPDHLVLIYQLATDRAPVSDLLGVHNEKLFMFWCLYFAGEYIHYIKELDLLVVYKRADNQVTIYDIVGRNVPTFDELYPFIQDQNDKTAKFLFMTDKMNVVEPEYIETTDNGTHLCGDFPLENEKFTFPITAQA